jgi:hypothetical protein
MKQFVFLYPIPEIIDFEIEQGAYGFRDEDREKEFLQRLKKAKSEDEKESIRQKTLQVIKSEFRVVYRNGLNACIDTRYRRKGFGISYAVFDGSPVSNVINLQQSDRIIEVGLDFKTHTTKHPNGEYPYPDQDHILNQFNGMQVLRIAGFHMWDCVERLAKNAYERGLDTLVDEDLTEFFTGRLRDPDFKIDRYPTYNPRKAQGSMFDIFMEARKERPWLWQDY